jgi:hypothetical protein
VKKDAKVEPKVALFEQPQAPAPTPPRKSSSGLIVLALITGGLMGAGGILVATKRPWLQAAVQPTPAPVVAQPTPDPRTEIRFRGLVTSQLNTLDRVKDTEAEVLALRAQLKALAKEHEDMSLRIEMLSRDFRPIHEAKDIELIPQP